MEKCIFYVSFIALLDRQIKYTLDLWKALTTFFSLGSNVFAAVKSYLNLFAQIFSFIQFSLYQN